MYGGRGMGRGRGQRRQRRVMRFIQPCLLVMLHPQPTHGYDLLNGLGEFGFTPEQLDPSTVYRALREMEEDGLVTSQWDEESMGPQRRVYALSPLGESHLAGWIEDLRQARAEIETLIKAYEAVRNRPE